jgi:DNA integrity scanning protein DisA with diadenylate cyclase activity
VTDQVAPPRNREELVARLGDMRQQGILDLSEEARLLQHYDELLRDVEEEKARLEPEYERRRAEDGLDAANAWLADAARDLGRRHGEATRKITDQLQVVTG